MKKTLLLGITVLALSAFTIISGTWKNDAAHSQLGFTVTHLGVSDISGTFNDFEVMVKASKPDFSDASFELSAKAASIDTRVGMRDDHLKSADFFDAEKYPALTFKSTSLKKTANNKYKLAGNLTIHGVTRPVILDLAYNGTIEHPMNKKPTAGFTLSGTIKRSDFDLGAKFPAPMISDEVEIHASGEFTQN
jgi:polyisoprenoid-binding protein YceI